MLLVLMVTIASVVNFLVGTQVRVSSPTVEYD